MMWYSLFLLSVIECVFTLPNTNESAPEIHLISAPVGDRVVLSCGNVNNSHRIYEWLENGRPLEMTGDNLTLHLNGSLDFRLRMENADRIVTCRSYNSFPNGTQDSLLEYSYGFVPIVKAFLAETVHNVTVDWGATYRFPCVFGGTNPRKDIMMLNGAVVTEMEHNITEDSVVECKVQNNLSTVHDVAYIKVRPDSKTWIIKHGTSDRQSHCQLYSSVLPKSSICYPFIENIANEYKDPYLISQSRVYSSELSNQAIENLFNSWDKLFSLSSTSMYLSETNANFSDLLNSSNTKSNMTMSTENLPSASWRCINWAKHLTCAMSYPRCEIHGPDTVSQSFLVNDYIEYPVCAKHCLAVASLFCYSPLNISNNSAVDGLIHNILQNESSTPQYIRTGWSELISVPEAKNPNLISFSDFAANETSMYSFPMCSSADGYTTSSTSLTKSLCTQLPLEKRFPKSYAEQIQKIDNQQDFDCITGNGENYIGSATVPGCVPWANLKFQEDDNVQNLPPNVWPGLYALNSFTFPHSLGYAASSSAVCRNPAGLASKPFCLSQRKNEDNYLNPFKEIQSNPHEKLFLILCHEIPQCLKTNLSEANHNWTTAAGSNGELRITKVRSEKTVAYSVVGFIICLLVLISCILWSVNRCDKNVSNSNLNLPQLNFGKSSGEGDKNSFNESDQVGKGFSQRLNGSSGGAEEKRLERRRRLLNRRRRLRQLNPCLRCILGLYYLCADFVQSASTHNQPHSVFSIIHSPVDRNSSSVRGETATTNVAYLSTCFCLPRFREKVKCESFRMNQSTSSCARPSKCVIDEEFEANTLGISMGKSGVCVTNVPEVFSPPSAIESSTNICVTCGVSRNVLLNMCSSCRNSQQNATAKKDTSLTVGSYSDCDKSEQMSSLALVDSSIQSLSSASVSLGTTIFPDKLFNMASMVHLLHPKLKLLCYPRSRLTELRCLARRAFGWVLLVRAPNLDKLINRRRLLATTTSETPDLNLSIASDSSTDDQGISDASDKIAVIKMFQRGINLDSEANFLREAEILVELEHKNIIQLFGVCVPLDPLSFLIEYMPYGDLNSFLRKYANGVSPGISTVNGELSNPRNLTVTPTSAFYKQSHEQYTGELTIKTLIEMIIDACEAMVYLSEVYYVHRDVATRSFLVGSKLIVKLSDFSLCRPVEPDVDFVSTSNESVPIKWLPVESILNGRFHLDTDVWSFGVFLWEVFSFAAEPFAEKSYEEVVSILERGDRLACPSHCPKSVYQLMNKCWSSKRRKRPKFTQIISCLKEILNDFSSPEVNKDS